MEKALKSIEFPKQLTRSILRKEKTCFLKIIPEVNYKTKLLGFDKETAVFQNPECEHLIILKPEYNINEDIILQEDAENAEKGWIRKINNSGDPGKIASAKDKIQLLREKMKSADMKNLKDLMPFHLRIKNIRVIRTSKMNSMDKLNEGIHVDFSLGTMTSFFWLPNLIDKYDCGNRFYDLDECFDNFKEIFLGDKIPKTWIFLYDFDLL